MNKSACLAVGVPGGRDPAVRDVPHHGRLAARQPEPAVRVHRLADAAAWRTEVIRPIFGGGRCINAVPPPPPGAPRHPGWSGPLFGGGRCECFGPTEVIRAIFNGGRHECSEMIRANFVGGRYINAVSEVLRAALSEHSP